MSLATSIINFFTHSRSPLLIAYDLGEGSSIDIQDLKHIRNNALTCKLFLHGRAARNCKQALVLCQDELVRTRIRMELAEAKLAESTVDTVAQSIPCELLSTKEDQDSMLIITITMSRNGSINYTASKSDEIAENVSEVLALGMLSAGSAIVQEGLQSV